MRGFRHQRLSPDEFKNSRSPNSSFDLHHKCKLTREVTKEKRRRLNAERREERAKGKLGELREKFCEMEEKVDELEVAVVLKSDENETMHEKVEELEGRNVELKQEVKHLTAKFDSRVRREPQKIETAVRRALSTVFITHQTAYAVKTTDGTIQNWARNVILHLICASDVPAAKTWTAFSAVVEGLGISVEGSWSARSAGRIVLEGALAAEEMIVEDFEKALGRLLVVYPVGCLK